MNKEEDKIITRIPEVDFARFYLEQDSQKSNVYYATARSAAAHYEILPAKVVYKKTRLKIAASIAVFCLLAVSAGIFFLIPQEKARLSAGSKALIDGGYEDILSAQRSLAEFNFKQSFFDFNSAYQSFHSARADASYFSALALSAAQYWPFNFFADEDSVTSDFNAELARTGLEAADSVGSFLKAARSEDGAGLAGALDGAKDAQKKLLEIKKKLEAADDDFFAGTISKLEGVVNRFDRIIPRFELAGWASGFDRPKTFLVVAQNTAQARATGGAITSVGAITIENGRVSEIFFDDVYNIDGQLQTKIVPPKPIQRMDTVWSMHNANWFLDFPTSARKMAYFYQKSRGAHPDGVIAVDEKALGRFLKMIGSVELLKYDLTIDEDNFSHLTAFNVMDERRAGQAKRVFNDFTEALFNKLLALPEEKIAVFFNLFEESAARKESLVWINDQKHERLISEMGWGGGVPEDSSSDYLAAVVANMDNARGGAVKQNIFKESEIADGGEVINTVRVERVYDGDGLSEEAQEPISEHWRLYAPAGSEIISVSGFVLPENIVPAGQYNDEFKTDDDVVFSERAMRLDSDAGVQVFQESGKAVFGGWVSASSKEPAVVTFKYKLPFMAGAPDKIDFVFQKQPGVESALSFKARRAGDPEAVSLYDGDFGQDISISLTKR